MHGSYTGNGTISRTLSLPMEPKILFLRDSSLSSQYRKTVLTADDKDMVWYEYESNGSTYKYWSTVGLSGSTLTFQTGRSGESAQLFNTDGQTYLWTAIY